MVFKPRFSIVGWVSNILFTVVLAAVLVAVFSMYKKGDIGSLVALIIEMVLLAPILMASIFFLTTYPTMRYIIENGTLLLKCGPFKWTITIQSIKSIAEKDLKYLPYSEGWKLPGYALFKIRYGDVGAVKMCATALTKQVLLIETDSELYGITPDNVDLFISALKQEV